MVQLLALAGVVALLVARWSEVQPLVWWIFSPPLAVAVAGAWCGLSDHLDEDPFRWWTPWTPIAPAFPALAYAFGPRRPVGVRR